MMLDDLDSLVAFCKQYSKECNIRNNRFAFGGSSSEGGVVIMYAHESAPDSSVSAIVTFATPVNVADTTWLELMQKEGITEKVGVDVCRPYYSGTLPDSLYYTHNPLIAIKHYPQVLDA